MSRVPSGAELVERALQAASADGTVVVVSESSTANLRWAANSLTTNGAVRSRTVLVISVMGRGVGVRSATGVHDDAGLLALVEAAQLAAREAGPATDFAELAGGAPDADFADSGPTAGIGVLEDFARALGSAFEDVEGDEVRLYGFANYDLTTTWLGSSNGLRRRHVQPTGTVEWNAKSPLSGASVWDGQVTCDFTDVDVAQTLGRLRTRLSWGTRRLELPAGRYETLLPPTAVADLMIYAYWSASGRAASEGRTVFSRAGGGTRVGQMFAPVGLCLRSDPHEPGLQTIPFVLADSSSDLSSVFDNGLAIAPVAWLDDGRLVSLVETRASAAHAAAVPAPFVSNLILEGGGRASLEDMVASTGSGLLVTCLWYIREVDPQTLLLTGLTRDGVYLVEGGEVVGAVNNFRFNESPVDLLGRITEVGASVRSLPREWADDFQWTKMPPLRVPDFNMSSVSRAT